VPGKSFSNQFEALFNNASVGIILVNSSGEIITANGFALNMFGYREKELISQKLDILIPQEYLKKHRHHHQDYFMHPESRSMGNELEIYALHKKGGKIPVEISLGHYAIRKENYAIAVIKDISEKKEREEELKELAIELEEKIEARTLELKATVRQLKENISYIRKKDEALQKVNHFLENLLWYAGTIIIATDPNGIITVFNPTAEKLLGYSAAEVIGKKEISIFHLPDETKERAKILSRELNKSVKPGFDTYVAKARFNIAEEAEWTLVRKDKTTFPASVTVSALHDEEDKITGYLGVAADISERKKTMENLEQALEKEKQLGELKSRFVSVASHEFRTPLSTILSSVYLLSKYTTTEEQPKREKHIERIDSSIKLLNEILNDFLSIGKIEEGRVQVRKTKFDVVKEISLATDEMRNLLKTGQEFIHNHSGTGMISLDPVLFRHIVTNLLSNAIKFSPEESLITIKTTTRNKSLTLSVKDTGIGIPEEDQKHLFERFFRAANAENIKGTGLGLHIVAKYTELMNGTIICKSRLQQGTEFIITFNAV